MKRTWCLLIVFLSAIAAHAESNEKAYLVEVTEVTQEKSNLIVTVEAYQSLETEMAAKNKWLQKAVELTTKEWKETHSASVPYPQQTALPGVVKSLGVFGDKAKAEQALTDLQSNAPKEQKKKLSGVEKQLEALQSQLNGMKLTSDNQTQVAGLQMRIKLLEDEVAKKKKKDAEMAANLIIARNIFMSKLQQLLAADTGSHKDAGTPSQQPTNNVAASPSPTN
jgi:hypothetical protein